MPTPRVLIVTDSTSDLPQGLASQLGITVVPVNVQFGNESFLDGVDLGRDEFYRRLVQGPVLPTTSAPALGVFAQTYRELADRTRAAGEELAGIVSVHLASNLSALFNSAWLGAQEVPDVPVRLVDSQQVSIGTGLLAIVAAQAAARGESLDTVAEMARERGPRTRLLALLDTLEYVRRSGRLGRAKWLLGTLLHVKPIIGVHLGVVQPPLALARTRSAGLDRLMEMAEELAPFEELAVVHARAPELAMALRERISRLHPVERIVFGEVGVAIGSYAGPGAVGFIGVQQARG